MNKAAADPKGGGQGDIQSFVSTVWSCVDVIELQRRISTAHLLKVYLNFHGCQHFFGWEI